MTSERMSSESAPISERERDILRLVAMGATNQQIANQLNISINTVKVHLRNIFEKIGAASRTEATVYAIRQGLVQLEAQQAAPAAVLAVDPPELAAPDLLTAVVAPVPAPADAPLDTATPAPAPTNRPNALAGASERPAQRRAWLLPVALGLVALLAGAVVYLLMRQTVAPPANPTVTTGAEALNRWKVHQNWPQPRSDFAVAPYDGKIYLIGGTLSDAPSGVVERYDPSKDQLVALNEKPTPVSHVQAVTIGGKIYVPGGEGDGGQVLASAEAYDPRTKQWETLPPLPAPRSRYALADYEGQLYLFGGWDGASYRAEVFVFDPRTRQWAERAAMRTPRRNAGAALVEERIYVVGGENEAGPLAVNERYDPTGDTGGTWETLVPLPAPVAAPTVVATVNSVLLFDPGQRTATEYSPSADAWRASVSVPNEIGLSSRAASLSTSIFLFGANAARTPGAVGEYQVIYSTLFPIINSGE